MFDRRSLFVKAAAGFAGISAVRGSGELERAADRFDRAADNERRLADMLDFPSVAMTDAEEDRLTEEMGLAVEELGDAELDLALLIDPSAREFDPDSHRPTRDAVAAVIRGRTYVVVADIAFDRPRAYRVGA